MLQTTHSGTRISIILPILLIVSSAAIGGAWTQAIGKYYFKVSTGYFQTSEEYNYLGDRRPLFEDLEIYVDPLYQEFQSSLYFEYGLSNRLTAVGKLPFKVAVDTRTVEGIGYFEGEQRNSTIGVGDLSIAGRLLLLEKPFVLSIQGGAKIPMGYDTSKFNEGPTLGTGNADYSGQLLLGGSLHSLPLYITGGIGYRFRTGPLHDEIFFSAELGAAFTEWAFKTELFGVRNTTTPPDIYGQTLILPLPGGGGEVPFRAYGDQHFLKLLSEAAYNVTNSIGLSSTIGYVLSGKNIVAGVTYEVGIIFSN